jgi:8-oxo-dGTP pyrophosphatase MutT (NUDIX family)
MSFFLVEVVLESLNCSAVQIMIVRRTTMETEKSCGAVVFTRTDADVKYVIIQSKEGIFGFPKGHMEGLETEIETAIREIKEETGLSVSFADGFRIEDSHVFVRKGQEIMKQIVYFLAEFSDQIPMPQESELHSIRLVDYDTAMGLFQFESSKKILTEAQDYLRFLR